MMKEDGRRRKDAKYSPLSLFIPAVYNLARLKKIFFSEVPNTSDQERNPENRIHDASLYQNERSH